jgi:hypothetical protein
MKFTIAATVLATLLTSACRSRPREVTVIERPATQPTTVIIEKEHVHGNNCGHYYYNGVWYADPEHVHVVQVR